MCSSVRVDAKAVARTFGLGRGGCLSEGPVARGRQGLVWRLETADGSWAVKVALHRSTEEEVEPDEKLMRAIEEQIAVSEGAKRAFREEILIRISSLARRGQAFTYGSHERLKEAIEKKLFADLRDVIKITTSTKTPDPDQLRRQNEVIDRLITDQGYCPVCANELLRYVGSLLNR